MKNFFLTLFFIVLFSFPFVFADLCSNSRIQTHQFSYDNPNTKEEFRWPNPASSIVFFSNHANEIFRSTDRGISWSSQNNFMPNINATTEGIMIHLTTDPNKVFFTGSGISQIWTTRDGGNNYNLLSLSNINPTKFVSFLTHNIISDWALLLAWTGNGKSHPSLYVTQDFGQTWKLIADNVIDANWGAINAYGMKKNKNAKNSTLLYVQYTPPTPNPPGDDEYYTTLYVTSDFGTSKTKINLDHVSKIWITNKGETAYFTQRLHPDNKDSRLYITHDDGMTVRQSNIPVQDNLLQNSFSILDVSTSSNFVLLSVEYQTAGVSWLNIFSSTTDSVDFTFVLKGVAKGNFTEFTGLNSSIYIANVYRDTSLLPNSPMDTLITFNKGGSWDVVNATSGLCSGGKCPLGILFGNKNVALDSSFYTPGIALTNGYLPTKSDTYNTYMTRDAGFNWFQVASGINAFAIGDSGGLLLFANVGQSTSTLSYTWNQGLNVSQCQFTDTPYFVTDIVTLGYGNTSTFFFIYGRTGNNRGVITTVDFSQFHQRDCTGLSTPGSNDSDYEYWSPSDVKGGCFLGQRITYVRRKRDRSCFTTVQETISQITYCPCTESDYECDYCFARNQTTGTCQLIPNCKPNKCSRGYRKVPGDLCSEKKGLDRTPHCSSGMVWGLVFLAFTVTGVIIAVVLYKTNQNFKDWALNVKDKIMSFSPKGRDNVEYSLVTNADMEADMPEDNEDDDHPGF